MRRFGFLLLALTAMSMIFFPHQRDRSGAALVPQAGDTSGAAPAGNSPPPVDAVAEAPRPAKVIPQPAAADPAPPVVKIAAEPVAPHPPISEPSAGAQAASTPGAAGEELSGEALSAAIQRELARLGCYEGRIDGKWGRNSRAALDDFNEHTGAAIDGEEPDAALLATLRSAPANACDLTTATSAGTTQQSVTAAMPQDEKKPALTERDVAYLPPWMREEKLANPDAAAVPSDDTSPAAPAADPAPRKAKSAKPRVEQRWKSRPARSREAWLPPGWPRSSR